MERRTLKGRASGAKVVPAAVAALPRSYLALMGEFPLRPIRHRAEYDRATKIIHGLALRATGLDVGEEAYLEVLEALVEKFDCGHFSIETTPSSPTHPLRMLVQQPVLATTGPGPVL